MAPCVQLSLVTELCPLILRCHSDDTELPEVQCKQFSYFLLQTALVNFPALSVTTLHFSLSSPEHKPKPLAALLPFLNPHSIFTNDWILPILSLINSPKPPLSSFCSYCPTLNSQNHLTVSPFVLRMVPSNLSSLFLP